MSQSVIELRIVLANTFAFYFRAHAFHWNVTGILFHSFHEYFGTLYNELWTAVDPIAEEIRALESLAPASLAEIVAPSEIQIDNSITPGTPQEMVTELLSYNYTVLSSLQKAHEAAAVENHDGLVNFIEDRIDRHAKIGWQLRAHLVE